jgi:hypothetical protein
MIFFLKLPPKNRLILISLWQKIMSVRQFFGGKKKSLKNPNSAQRTRRKFIYMSDTIFYALFSGVGPDKRVGTQFKH